MLGTLQIVGSLVMDVSGACLESGYFGLELLNYSLSVVVEEVVLVVSPVDLCLERLHVVLMHLLLLSHLVLSLVTFLSQPGERLVGRHGRQPCCLQPCYSTLQLLDDDVTFAEHLAVPRTITLLGLAQLLHLAHCIQ